MIRDYLKNAAVRARLSHAYIIEGETPEQRRSAAEDFIHVLMETDEHAAAQIEAGTHPDIVWLRHEKPMTISVREVREQICDTIGVRPFEGGRKLYIVDEAELMPPGAQNALLKTVEEPPEYSCILLMTKNKEMLLDTIRSRCIVLKCADSEEEAFSRPELLDGISFDISAGREHIDAVRASEIAAEVLTDGTGEAKKFLDYMRLWIRDGMAERGGSGTYDMTRAKRALELIDRAETRIRFNVNAGLTIEMMLMEI